MTQVKRFAHDWRPLGREQAEVVLAEVQRFLG